MAAHSSLIFSCVRTCDESPVAIQFRKPNREETFGTLGLVIKDGGSLYGVTSAHNLPGFDGKSLKEVPTHAYQVSTGTEGEHLGQNVLCSYNEKEAVDIAVFEINKHLYENIGPYFGLTTTVEDEQSMSVFLGNLENLIGVGVYKVGVKTGLTRGQVIDVTDDQIFIKPDDPDNIFAASGDSGSVVIANVQGKHVAAGIVQKIYNFYGKGDDVYENVCSSVSLRKSLQALFDLYDKPFLCPSHIKCFPCTCHVDGPTEIASLGLRAETDKSEKHQNHCLMCEFSASFYGQELNLRVLLDSKPNSSTVCFTKAPSGDGIMKDTCSAKKVGFDNSFLEQLNEKMGQPACTEPFTICDVIWKSGLFDNSFAWWVNGRSFDPINHSASVSHSNMVHSMSYMSVTNKPDIDYQTVSRGRLDSSSSSYLSSLDDLSQPCSSGSVGSDSSSIDGSLSNLGDLDQYCSFDDVSSDSDIANFTAADSYCESSYSDTDEEPVLPEPGPFRGY